MLPTFESDEGLGSGSQDGRWERVSIGEHLTDLGPRSSLPDVQSENPYIRM